ncbi:MULTISPECIES: GNAT family N-acetyltransferase [unclassified Novosphingobium]|uniref:GNAT family N-acetyltransferase n=1 Tax=unclassified Novosphingobium TaxID=2644732 RepID=UPI00146F9171|nr:MULTISPECIES: GNAT family N-acetyltransferase [unclassified Novosphingobium]NMN04158.1 ribosomal protein S18 acetylase RimI-like enzyme [Novosphingobium sp. SG919]NMN85850.1 ribosomal protein S18 acetylase RimI-like enzyme [Novosphingobium sp. SG916]
MSAGFVPLDRPVWHALNGPQRALSRWTGAEAACRIDPGYGPFAAAAPGAEEHLAKLLAAPDDELWTVEPQAVVAPSGLAVRRVAPLVQMVADARLAVPERIDAPDIVPLGEADVPAMTALALATKPGPWGPDTWRYGQFYGIFLDGRLAAMAGERMRPAPGFAEVSGVATWPEFRGRGLAARLIGHVRDRLLERGDKPFLHSYAENAAAIRLYERLGFRIRRPLCATVLARVCE